MDANEYYDLRKPHHFDEFVDFLFDHEVVPAPASSNEPGPWYWHGEVVFDPIRVAGFYIKLFQEPRFLSGRFSIPHLEQGFWAIPSGTLDCAISQIIWHRDVPLETRETCIRTMFHLFEKLFANVELDTAPYMWWDSLAYDWHCGNRDRAQLWGGRTHTRCNVRNTRAYPGPFLSPLPDRRATWTWTFASSRNGKSDSIVHRAK